MFEPVTFAGKKILITGATGLVGLPLVEAYSKEATVYAMARYGRSEDRRKIEGLGGVPLAADLVDRPSLRAIPDDIDYVINCAVARTGRFDVDLQTNADGVGFLMARCRNACAFLHFSSTAVYEHRGHEPRKESDPLGDNHRAMFPTYSISKIAGERVCAFAARQFEMPTTIARLCVPYGDCGGWPFFHLMMMRNGAPVDVHPDRPNRYNLLHVDDCIEKIPRLLAAATPEVTLTNFAGSPPVSIEEWCGYMGELTGLEPRYIDNPSAFGSLCTDLAQMESLIGRTHVDWRDGIRRMISALAPDLMQGSNPVN
jgi:UDP-glucuronate 4-epimerase